MLLLVVVSVSEAWELEDDALLAVPVELLVKP